MNEEEEFRAAMEAAMENLTTSLRKSVEFEREYLRLLTQGEERRAKAQLALSDLAGRVEHPAEQRALIAEMMAIRRQTKALWLRIILEDYEF